MYKLVMSDDLGAKTKFIIHKDKVTTIGRDPKNVLVLNDKTVSPLHASISFENGKVYIKDEKSVNGVMVNGTKIRGKEELKLNDHIVIGLNEFFFEEEVEDENHSFGEQTICAKNFRMDTEFLDKIGAEADNNPLKFKCDIPDEGITQPRVLANKSFNEPILSLDMDLSVFLNEVLVPDKSKSKTPLYSDVKETQEQIVFQDESEPLPANEFIYELNQVTKEEEKENKAVEQMVNRFADTYKERIPVVRTLKNGVLIASPVIFAMLLFHLASLIWETPVLMALVKLLYALKIW